MFVVVCCVSCGVRSETSLDQQRSREEPLWMTDLQTKKRKNQKSKKSFSVSRSQKKVDKGDKWQSHKQLFARAD